MTICILGRPYTVRYVEAHDLVDVTVGATKSREAVITIDRDLDPVGMKQILLHEICHAISTDLGLGLTERQTAALGVGLASIAQLKLAK